MKKSLLNHTLSRVAGWSLLLALLAAISAQGVEPRVRLSFKFILNASGNRPGTGNINTDAEIEEQLARGNQIFANLISEFRYVDTEILEVSGQSAYYSNGATDTERDQIRNAAIANPGTFFWRNNAINIYITGSSDSAISKFPPNNDIIILCQGVFDTTLAHEVGHSLNLSHTHSGSETCSDTLPDNEDWTRDGIAQNAYGLNYNQLNAAQKQLVDNTWNNLMSYHDPDNRSFLTLCQMDRESAQGYTDRSWLLSKTPVYVDNGAGGTMTGSWTQPFQSVQGAINANALNNRVLVLKTGTHADPSSTIITDTDIVTRRGTSVCREVEPAYRLPYDVESSTNAAVRAAVIRAQQLDRQGDATGVVAALSEAAQAATGRERDALNLEIAQRLRAMKRFTEADQFFTKVSIESDQPALRAKGLSRANAMKTKALEQSNNRAAGDAANPEASKDQP